MNYEELNLIPIELSMDGEVFTDHENYDGITYKDVLDHIWDVVLDHLGRNSRFNKFKIYGHAMSCVDDVLYVELQNLETQINLVGFESLVEELSAKEEDVKQKQYTIHLDFPLEMLKNPTVDNILAFAGELTKVCPKKLEALFVYQEITELSAWLNDEVLGSVLDTFMLQERIRAKIGHKRRANEGRFSFDGDYYKISCDTVSFGLEDYDDPDCVYTETVPSKAVALYPEHRQEFYDNLYADERAKQAEEKKQAKIAQRKKDEVEFERLKKKLGK